VPDLRAGASRECEESLSAVITSDHSDELFVIDRPSESGGRQCTREGGAIALDANLVAAAFVAAQVVQGSRGQDTTLVEHDHGIARPLDVRQQMCREDHVDVVPADEVGASVLG